MNAQELIENDAEHELVMVDKIEPCTNAGDPGWIVTADDGFSIFVPGTQCAVVPETGETFFRFGRGIGYSVRGLVIGGRVYRYQTREQHEAEQKAYWQSETRKKQQAAHDERPKRDMQIAKLPAPLQDRVHRFQRMRDNWAADFEPYELFVCEEAAEIARLFPCAADIKRFHGADYEAQRAMAPTLRLGEHSGNTFGSACLLARILIEEPELVAHAHGALCPLVGCNDYGCYAACEGKQGMVIA